MFFFIFAIEQSSTEGAKNAAVLILLHSLNWQLCLLVLLKRQNSAILNNCGLLITSKFAMKVFLEKKKLGSLNCILFRILEKCMSLLGFSSSYQCHSATYQKFPMKNIRVLAMVLCGMQRSNSSKDQHTKWFTGKKIRLQFYRFCPF